MKDNLNIEKLFKDKFENFEGNVNPDLWANISQGITSNAAAGSSVGLGVKALIIGISAITVGVTAYFVGDFNTSENNVVQTDISIKEPVQIEQKKSQEKTRAEKLIIVEEKDPVISDYKSETIETLIKMDAISPAKEVINLTKNDKIRSNDDVVVGLETVPNITVKDGGSVKSVNDKTSKGSNNDGSTSSSKTDNLVEKSNDQSLPLGNIEMFTSLNIFEFEFNSNPQNFVKVSWDFGDGIVSLEENPTHVFDKVGTYLVQLSIESNSGETYKETKLIEIESTASIDNIANVITPNGDGVNDGFFVNAIHIEEFSITIINQAGETVFKSSDKNFVWNGTDFIGNSVEKAVFSYYIIARGIDGAILKIPGQLYVR